MSKSGVNKPNEDDGMSQSSAPNQEKVRVTYTSAYLLSFSSLPLTQLRPEGMAYIPGVTTPPTTRRRNSM